MYCASETEQPFLQKLFIAPPLWRNMVQGQGQSAKEPYEWQRLLDKVLGGVPGGPFGQPSCKSAPAWAWP